MHWKRFGPGELQHQMEEEQARVEASRKYLDEIESGEFHNRFLDTLKQAAEAEKRRQAESERFTRYYMHSGKPSKVYVGPRGGEYIIVNGKKLYLSSLR